jgi:signal transduction histidine kinase
LKLINKAVFYYFLVSIIIFTTGGIIFYEAVRIILIRQITDNLISEKNLIEEDILNSDSIPDYSTIFGHEIAVTIYNAPLKRSEEITNKRLIKPFDTKAHRYRYLCVTGVMRDKKGYYRGYTIEMYKSLSETQKLIFTLFLVVWLVLVLLLLILGIVNLWISKKMWIPFFEILSKLSRYKADTSLPLNLSLSGIKEFDQLTHALNAMSERIRADFVNLKEFTEDVTHEIHTPLSIIKLKLELLFQAENLSEEQFQNIHAIYEAVSRLEKMNNSLLLISRIQNQQYPDVNDVNLAMLIEKFLSNFREVIIQKNITISKQCNNETTLRINPDLADIMISNLLGNALKHNVQNGNISIELNSHELIIRNTGRPISSSPEHLFSRFRTGSESGDSSGLGLAIVKKVISPYNIQIEYSTRDNVHTMSLAF